VPALVYEPVQGPKLPIWALAILVPRPVRQRTHTPTAQCYPVYLVESVANVIEGDGQVLGAAQGCELTIWWRVGD
jgi:hypothetical protein